MVFYKRKVVRRRRRVRRRPVYRRRFAYRKSRNSARAVMTRMPQPDRILTKFKYCEYTTMSPPVDGSYTTYSWQTSMYKPSAWQAGHQPLWHDTYASVYSYYRVYGIKYTIQYSNQTSHPCYIIVTSKQSSQSFNASFQTESERRNVQHRYVISGNGQGYKTFVGYISAPKVFGISNKEYRENDNFLGTFGYSPNSMAQLAFLVQGVSGASTPTSQIFVTLTLYCEMWGRQLVTGS